VCAGARRAGVVGAPGVWLDEPEVSLFASSLARAPGRAIQGAIPRAPARHPSLPVAVVTGLGAFLGRAAAEAAGLQVVPLASEVGESAARCAPATSVAQLFERQPSTAS
jgi:uncharacterized hydantoinase/oxoprolinase family protein